MTDLLNIREAAQLLRLSVSQVYKLVETRRIESIKAGGAVRFTEEALERWVKARTVPEKPQGESL